MDVGGLAIIYVLHGSTRKEGIDRGINPSINTITGEFGEKSCLTYRLKSHRDILSNDWSLEAPIQCFPNNFYIYSHHLM